MIDERTNIRKENGQLVIVTSAVVKQVKCFP